MNLDFHPLCAIWCQVNILSGLTSCSPPLPFLMAPLSHHYTCQSLPQWCHCWYNLVFLSVSSLTPLKPALLSLVQNISTGLAVVGVVVIARSIRLVREREATHADTLRHLCGFKGNV